MNIKIIIAILYGFTALYSIVLNVIALILTTKAHYKLKYTTEANKKLHSVGLFFMKFYTYISLIPLIFFLMVYIYIILASFIEKFE